MKPNFKADKRRKEAARKKKQEEKRNKRLSKPADAPELDTAAAEAQTPPAPEEQATTPPVTPE